MQIHFISSILTDQPFSHEMKRAPDK